MATHQCTHFSSDPKQSHADTLRYIGKYLIGTKDEGIYLDPRHDKSFECWVDADFLKGAPDMHLDAMTVKPHTGFLITYAGCPITWGSKLQQESALSMMESEYMAISESFPSLLPMMVWSVDRPRVGMVGVVPEDHRCRPCLFHCARIFLVPRLRRPKLSQRLPPAIEHQPYSSIRVLY
jgi:hypothetical protein